MKTAIQEIIERANLGIQTHESELSNSDSSNIERNRHTYLLNVCKMFHGLASELLEKEKQQIIDAYREGTYYNTIGNKDFESEEEYYNETYKNK